MTVYILFEDSEDYDAQSTVIDVFASEKGAIDAMETAVTNRANNSTWSFIQINERKWVRNGRDKDGFHVEPWEVIP
jgi:hypothetical protein